MPSKIEQLFSNLSTTSAVLALIGGHEDAYLDCKEWHPRDSHPEKWLAKAICGLTNAEGGVLVIGLRASSKPKDQPDIIEAAAPVANTSLVKARILDLVGKHVEPGIVGIDAREVPDASGSPSGFVVVFVPATEGRPRRSLVDSRFYQRIGSITLPMQYFQIEERFGVRPHPKLELFWEEKGFGGNTWAPAIPGREVVIGLSNTGAGIAKFPSVSFQRALGLGVNSFGIDGNGGFGLRMAPTDGQLVAFRGGVNDVIHPGETVKIAILVQQGENVGIQGIPIAQYPAIIRGNRETHHRWVFPEVAFQCQISSEGMETKTVEAIIPENSVIMPNQN